MILTNNNLHIYRRKTDPDIPLPETAGAVLPETGEAYSGVIPPVDEQSPEPDFRLLLDANNDGSPIVFRVFGAMSTFGGPGDLGMSPSEGLAFFTRDDLRNPAHAELFLPQQPSGTTGLGRRLNPEVFYLACRWNYSQTPRSFLRQTKARVTNPRNGRSFLARPADWGPHARTGRVGDLSPGLADALGLETDDDVIIEMYHGTPISAAADTQAPPQIVTCAEWGARHPRVNEFAERDAAGIVLHNTEHNNRAPAGTPTQELAAAKDVARGIQRFHMDKRGWADTGQHFTISRGGIILEGRHGSAAAARQGRVVQAAHASSTSGEMNRRWFGIEVEGDNRRAYRVTPQQEAAIVELCAWLTKWAGEGALRIVGHRDVLAGHTDCPGHMLEYLDNYRTQITQRRRQLG